MEFLTDGPSEQYGSEESLISDTEIFKSIRRGQSKRRWIFHKLLLVLAISSALILVTAIFINYQGIMHGNEVKMRAEKLFEFWNMNKRDTTM